ADQTSGELLVTATELVPIGETHLEIRATGSGNTDAQATCILTILKPPVPPPAIRLTLSPSVVLDQQSKNKFMARIVRDRFEGVVKLAFTDLPKGVTIPATTIPKDKTQIDIEAVADKNAVVGERNFGAVAEGPKKQDGTPTAQASAKIIVKPYVEPPPPVVDILFLVDVTGSMGFAIRGVSDGIQKFSKNLQDQRLDVRIGLIAFRDRFFPNQEPQILTFGPKNEVFTKDTEAFQKKVALLRAGGGGGTLEESSLDAIVLGCKQEFRYQAVRVIVHITDAGPNIPDKDTPTLEAATKVIEEKRIDQLHFVVRPKHREIYEKLRHPRMKGQFFDLEKAARGANDFEKMMPEVSEEIARTTVASVAPKAPPEESLVPPLPPAAKSAVDIPPTPEPAVLKGVTSTANYAADSKGRLLLATSVWTAIITAGVCLLLIVGQNLYLRQSWGPAATNLKGIGGGLLVGIIGGGAGQLSFQFSSGGAILFRFLGWTILGGLAGAGLAFFIPNLRTSKGLLGGAAGGAIGAFGFILTALLLSGTAAGDVAARLLGATLLGLCIGLMVALAERMFRTAWLEINFGENVVKVVNLGPDPVSIGSDAKQCTIFARKAAPQAFRFWVRHGKLIQQDMANGKETELRSGETQKIGMVDVLVCTSGNKAPIARKPMVEPVRVARSEMPLTKTESRPVPPPPPPPKPVVVAKAPPPPPPPPKPKDFFACPGCGRKLAGKKGERYCMVCDATY
ncbi:MAG: VWA domain-containing protein, partial [Planctomycetes bacterium]|nr:VWA domain-containing protein [Planctomycetota bacterium]